MENEPLILALETWWKSDHLTRGKLVNILSLFNEQGVELY